MTDLNHCAAVARGEVDDPAALEYLSSVGLGEIADDGVLALLYDLTDARELMPLLVERVTHGDRRKTAQTAHQDTFAMLPGVVVTSALDDGCVRLYAFLDWVQGKDGRPPAAGIQATADRLGWSRNSVATHAKHLEAEGLIACERDGRKRVVLVVVHNPSRKRLATGVAVKPAIPHKRAARKNRYATEPSVAQGMRDAAFPQSDPDAQTSGVPSRKANASDAQPECDRLASASASEKAVCAFDNRDARDVWPDDEVLDRILEAFPGAASVAS